MYGPLGLGLAWSFAPGFGKVALLGKRLALNEKVLALLICIVAALLLIIVGPLLQLRYAPLSQAPFISAALRTIRCTHCLLVVLRTPIATLRYSLRS
jgi:hypothetical protein